jgi:hypothetical protein
VARAGDVRSAVPLASRSDPVSGGLSSGRLYFFVKLSLFVGLGVIALMLIESLPSGRGGVEVEPTPRRRVLRRPRRRNGNRRTPAASCCGQAVSGQPVGWPSVTQMTMPVAMPMAMPFPYPVMNPYSMVMPTMPAYPGVVQSAASAGAAGAGGSPQPHHETGSDSEASRVDAVRALVPGDLAVAASRPESGSAASVVKEQLTGTKQPGIAGSDVAYEAGRGQEPFVRPAAVAGSSGGAGKRPGAALFPAVGANHGRPKNGPNLPGVFQRIIDENVAVVESMRCGLSS